MLRDHSHTEAMSTTTNISPTIKNALWYIGLEHPKLQGNSKNHCRREVTHSGPSFLLNFPKLSLTGSRPSMASIHSLRSSSDSACMVMTPGLRRKVTDMNPVPQVERA